MLFILGIISQPKDASTPSSETKEMEASEANISETGPKDGKPVEDVPARVFPPGQASSSRKN